MTMKKTKAAIATLPEWAQTHISAVRDQRNDAVERADAAERQVRDMAAEIKRLNRELAEARSK